MVPWPAPSDTKATMAASSTRLMALLLIPRGICTRVKSITTTVCSDSIWCTNHGINRICFQEMTLTHAERAVVHKLAWRFLPLLILAYLINYLDRTSVSIAALTMNHELGLTATQFGFGA